MAAVFDHREKPALGMAPEYLKERVIPGFQPADTQMLRVIYQDAVDKNHPIWSPEELSPALGALPQDAQLDSLETLEEQG